MALFKTEIRIQIVGLIFLLGISAIIGKLWHVQVVKGDYYTQKIRGSGEVTVRIPSVRGEIRDRNGVKLVTNRPSYSVEFFLNDMVKGYQQAFGKKNVPDTPAQSTPSRAFTRRPTSPTWAASCTRPSCRAWANSASTRTSTRRTPEAFPQRTRWCPYVYLEDIEFDEMAKLSERDLGLPGVDADHQRRARIPLRRAGRAHPRLRRPGGHRRRGRQEFHLLPARRGGQKQRRAGHGQVAARRAGRALTSRRTPRASSRATSAIVRPSPATTCT